MLFLFILVIPILGLTCSDQFYNSLTLACESCPSGTGIIDNQCTCANTINAIPTCTTQSTLCVLDNGQWTTTSCSCSNHAISTTTSLCQQCPNNQINSNNVCGCTSNYASDGYCVTALTNIFTDTIAQSIGPKAYQGCNTYNDMKSCQQLANLFALKRSSSTSESDYQYLYASILSFQANTTKNMPQIIYTGTATTLIEDTSIQMLVNFKSNNGNSYNQLPLYIMEYYIDGTVSPLRELQNQLQLCSSSYGDTELASYFGVEYTFDCDLDLTKYTDDENYETTFYQIWLKDIDGTYIPIPVKIAGYNGNTAGTTKSDYGYENAQFIYRFFTVDNLRKSQTITYAQTIKLISYLSSTEDDKTFLPYLYIIYSDQLTYTDIANTKYYPVEYQNNHYQAQTNFYTVATIIFVIAQIFIVIVWIIRMYIWSKRNPSYTAQYDWCMYLMIRSFYILLDTWAEVMFYYLAIFTGYLFCFFKFQQTIFILMPPLSDYADNYRVFEVIFYIMLACRLISLINLIIRQSDVQVFFIDWEKSEVLRPKELSEQLNPNILNLVQEQQSKQSAWRMILIANEFNELQVYRTVSVEWTLIFMGFFLEGLNWINLSQQQPNVTLDKNLPKNYVLQYFLCTFLYMIIGLVQIVIQKLFDIWFPILVEDFVDLCAISNVSIVILDDVLHGYYIHGENPIGVAEGSSEHLANCLRYEALGKGKKRGFVTGMSQENKNDDELQTFEIFLPMKFRDAYEQVYNLPLKQMTDKAQYQNYNEIRILRQTVPDGLEMAGVQAIKDVFQSYIKDILTQVRTHYSQVVRDKLPVQRFFNYPPADLEDLYFKDQAMPVFFRDPNLNFKQMFFCGHEYFFLITDTIVFNFWMILVNNTYVSILLTYLISIGIFNYRRWIGERNLADQSKIDQRFLI